MIPNTRYIRGAGHDGTDEVQGEWENRVATVDRLLDLLPGAYKQVADIGAGKGPLGVRAQARWGARIDRTNHYEIWKPMAPPDLVTMVHVLDHLESPAFALRRIHRLMQPNGHLLIVVHNWNCLSHWFLWSKWPPRNPYHTFLFKPHTLRWVVEDAGFDVLKAGKVWNKYSVGHVLGQMLGRQLPWTGPSLWWPLGNIYVVAQKRRLRGSKLWHG